MSKSIAVFGAGPGLGQAIARRYAQEGYTVVVVARGQQPLEALAKELTSTGATAHAITADLSDTAAIPRLAEQVRGRVGHLDAFYYGPAGPADPFVPAAALTPQRAEAFMPLTFFGPVALVQEFLPQMIERGDGAILTAQGASTLHGMPGMSGPGPGQAALRNYFQSLHAEVAGTGVYVGSLYIGAAIENTPFHAQLLAARAAGAVEYEMAIAAPVHLADLLWNMHASKAEPEAAYPEGILHR
jgi:short-subunit dehydrogenase